MEESEPITWPLVVLLIAVMLIPALVMIFGGGGFCR